MATSRSRGTSSTIRSIHIHRMTRISALGRRRPRAEFPLDKSHERLDGEDLPDIADLRILLQLRKVRVRQASLERRDALGRHLPVLHELRVLLHVLREQLPLPDLELERLLELEHDVEEIDRLGPEIPR